MTVRNNDQTIAVQCSDVMDWACHVAIAALARPYH